MKIGSQVVRAGTLAQDQWMLAPQRKCLDFFGRPSSVGD